MRGALIALLFLASCMKADMRRPGEWIEARARADARANALIEGSRFDEALGIADSLIAAGENDSRTLGQKARALGGLGREDEAIAVFEEALLADYESCENHLHFANYLMRLGKTGRAQTEFMEAKRFCEGKYDPLIYRNLAVAGIKLDKRDLARRYVEEGLGRDANDPYLNGLKGMLIARENPAAAESLFVKSRSLGGAPPEFLVQYGLLLINEGRPLEAAGVLDEASRLRPGDRQIAIYLAEALDRAGDYDGASAILDDLLAGGDEAEVRKLLARVRFHKGDYERALKLYMKLDQSPEVLDRIAMCLHNLGRTDEAIPWARKALAERSDWPQGMINLAVMLASRGDLDEAASLLERALSIEPDNVSARANLDRLEEAKKKQPRRK
ncbi:MAG: tetratricopeptide repeat protein [Candidatus Krumholzibacteria bacterium]|nr:tetratricopeptide repeat protein [Candidatus Krumholzibacteria bacterium]